jgi:hypothetical protein
VAAFLRELGWGVKMRRPLFLYPQSAFEARHYHDYKQVQRQSGLPVYVVFQGSAYPVCGWVDELDIVRDDFMVSRRGYTRPYGSDD